MLAVLRQRNFALLWTGALISMIGDWMLFIGLPVYVYQLTGSTLATSIMVMSGLLPGLLLGSVAGVFVDRWDRRRTMIAASLLSALVLLPLLAVGSADQLWIIYLVNAARTTITQFFGPAENALLPQLVAEEQLVQANGLNALNNNLARLIGPPLGGLATSVLGLGGVALLDAASFLIAAALIGCVITSGTPQEPKTAASEPVSLGHVWREWLAGLALVRGNRLIATIFLMLAICQFGEGIFSVLFVPFVTTMLGGSGVELGWLLGAQAIGGLLGGLLVGPLSRVLPPRLLIGLGSVLFGLIDLLIFNAPLVIRSLPLTIVLFILVGIPAVAAFTSLNTLLQTGAPDRYRGRVFGALGTTMSLMTLVGSGITGVLGDLVGIIPLLNIQGGVYIVAGLIALTLPAGARFGQRRAEGALVKQAAQ